MIIGTGIFGALGATAEKAGSALLLAMIPGALVAWSTGVSGAQLGVNFPEAGGAFVWARAFHLTHQCRCRWCVSGRCGWSCTSGACWCGCEWGSVTGSWWVCA